MKKGCLTGGLIGLGVLVLIAIILFTTFKNYYNNFVTLEEGVNEKWSQVENVYQRRADLIPNLVETVKGYAKHEKELLVEVTKARASVAGAKSINEKIKANNQLSSVLSRLLVVVERYPQLKANENFLRLQDELAGTENRIAVERRRYNESVRRYNTTLRGFPTNIVANLLGFKRAAFFQAPESAKKVPKVKF